MRRNKPVGKPTTVTILGPFGQGNLGNDSILLAVLRNLDQQVPHAAVKCVCTGPEAVTRTFGIAAAPVDDEAPSPPSPTGSSFTRWAWRLLVRVPHELRQLVKAYRFLNGTGMLMVPGTQMLSDNLTGTFGGPYAAFKWVMAAKLRRCRVVFLSIGIGPLRRRMSRLFVRAALRVADYRSYRDELSRRYMCEIGFNARADRVCPDLAFALDRPPLQSVNQEGNRRPVLAVGVHPYYGQFEEQGPAEDGEGRYARYLDSLAGCIKRLIQEQFIVRLVIGDVVYDRRVISDLKGILRKHQVLEDDAVLIDEPIESVEQLMAQLAVSDIIISSRFHNLVLGLLLGKPVIALSYHGKCASLVKSIGMKEHCQHIEHMNVDKLIALIRATLHGEEAMRPAVARKVEEFQRELEGQYATIFRKVEGHMLTDPPVPVRRGVMSRHCEK